MSMIAFLLAATLSPNANAWQTPVDEFSPYADLTRDAKVDVKDDFDGDVKAVKYLPSQGWTPAESMRFYRLPQGSKLIPYRWFVSLEQAKNQTPFADPANMNRYRYLPLKPHATLNPDGLPVGFVREPMQPGDPLKLDWLGFTCAACHTGEIRHNNVAYRIDGAPALADHDQFLLDMVDAMKATLDDGGKFDRFAVKVLTVSASPAAKAKLKTNLLDHYEFRKEYNARNKTNVPYGFARLDAFGRIMNEVLVRHIEVDEPAQIASPNAPVSYPHLWGITTHDRVQWNGVADNTKPVVGPLGRNVGEVLGVFGEVEVPSLFEGLVNIRPDFGFKSTVRFRNLMILEDTVKTLKAPRWEDVFDKLDPVKVANGKVHFQNFCLSCHNPTLSDGFVRTTLTPINKAGTDPAMAKNFADRVGKAGNMKFRLTKQKMFGLDIGFFSDKPASARSLLVGVVGRTIVGADPTEFHDRVNLPQVLKDVRDLNNLFLGKIAKARNLIEKLDAESYLSMSGKNEASLMVYRGRPLEGIWASAPYLHNGSVPNLEELLLPAADRSREFKVGSREFDPKKVGFRTDKGFLFDTTKPGNLNTGHEYHTEDLKKDDTKRGELLEYLKSL